MVGGSRDSLTGECSGHVLVPIYVLSRDGHSTSGSQDILTGRMGGGGKQCACAHPCTVCGWSQYLGVLGYSGQEDVGNQH